MDEMISANCGEVSVPGKNNDMERGICEFYPGGECNGTAMCRMERIRDNISRSP